MNKVTINLGEIYALDGELNGSVNQQTGARLSKGILSQQLPLLQKYWLGELNDEVAKQKKNIDKLRDDLVIKFGVADDKGGYTIPLSIDKLDEDGNTIINEEGETQKQINPKFEEFNQELTTLFEETREFEIYPFKVENMNFTTDEYYPVFMKLLKVKKDESAK
jgi:uncharacterized coiled-coil protein SlyX